MWSSRPATVWFLLWANPLNLAGGRDKAIGTSKWHAAKEEDSRHETRRSEEAEEKGGRLGDGVEILGTFFSGRLRCLPLAQCSRQIVLEANLGGKWKQPGAWGVRVIGERRVGRPSFTSLRSLEHAITPPRVLACVVLRLYHVMPRYSGISGTLAAGICTYAANDGLAPLYLPPICLLRDIALPPF